MKRKPATPIPAVTAPVIANEVWIDKQILMQKTYVSSRTVQRWMDTGEIPFSHIGGKVLFRLSAIEEVLRRNEQVRRPKEKKK